MSRKENGPIGYRKQREGGSPEITRVMIPTRGGNELMVFYNPELDLLVVDLIAYDEEGGNEIVRQKLNEAELLEHLT